MYCVMAGWKVQNTSRQALAFVEVTLKMIKSLIYFGKQLQKPVG